MCFYPIFVYYHLYLASTEVGVYKRKQESKKTRKQELDEECDQENKRKKKKTRSRPRKRPEKKEKTYFYSSSLSWSSSCFLSFFLVFLFSYFLVFFYKFPPLGCYCSFRKWRWKHLLQRYVGGGCVAVDCGKKIPEYIVQALMKC